MNTTKEMEKMWKDKDPSIKQLTEVLHTSQDIDCLRMCLQTAVTLEFATIPPYLCALWSIVDDLHPAAKSIREVVQEEMLHMALACNIMASIGGKPQINTAVPTYPGSLPGKVHPGLVAKLSGLTKAALEDFMWIERPIKEFQVGVLVKACEREVAAHDESIGQFYETIKEAFIRIDPPMSPDNQISGPLAWTVVRSIEDVVRAIELITHQGEGSGKTPEDTEGDLSHFYRFKEVYDEVRLVWDPIKKKLNVGDPFPFPEVLKMGVVPEGGYQEEHLEGLSEKERSDASYNLVQFDRTYTRLLDQLQGAWRLGGQASLIHAYETMFELEKYARPLMEKEIPGGSGETFGPCFRYDDEVGVRNKERVNAN